MADDEIEDPAANTQMFQAFMDRPREPESSGSRWLLVAGVAVAVVVVVVLAWFLLGG
jgi:hypothetical protein